MPLSVLLLSKPTHSSNFLQGADEHGFINVRTMRGDTATGNRPEAQSQFQQ